jgi:hypothetical protein
MFWFAFPWCWAYFHVPVSHLCIFFGKISIQILCPCFLVGYVFSCLFCYGVVLIAYTFWILTLYHMCELQKNYLIVLEKSNANFLTKIRVQGTSRATFLLESPVATFPCFFQILETFCILWLLASFMIKASICSILLHCCGSNKILQIGKLLNYKNLFFTIWKISSPQSNSQQIQCG